AFPKSVTVDLGAQTEIHLIRYGTPEIGSTKTVAVSVSEDGQTFPQVGRHDLPPTTASRADAKFAPRKARYVRASFLANHPKQDNYSENFCFLAELEAYAP